MSTPDKQKYVRSAIHTSGGINKALLTPYRRIGLSRNINKLFKSPIITNESEVLKSLSKIGTSSTPSSTPTKPILSEETHVDETPKTYDTPIPSRSLQNKHTKEAKIKPRISFTKKLDIIENDKYNNEVKSGDFSDSDSEPLIAIKNADVPKTQTDTPIPSRSLQNKHIKKAKIKPRVSFTKKLDIIECNNEVESSDFADIDSEPLIAIKNLPKQGTNTLQIKSTNTPEPPIIPKSHTIDKKVTDTNSNKPPKQDRKKLKKRLSLKRSNSSLTLSNSDDDFVYKPTKINRISSDNFSMECNVKLEKLPSNTILDALNNDSTPTNSQTELNLHKQSSSTIPENLNMDITPTNSQKDVKVQKMSSSTILEGLNINSTPTNSQADETTTPHVVDKASLIKSVQDLSDSIKAKEKKLEQLKQACLYKKKHNVGKLQDEVDVWRNGCKEALVALHGCLQENGPITLQGLMVRLNIPTDMFKYDEQNDCLL